MPLQLGGNVQGFKILKVILYIKHTKYGVSKTQAPQPPALYLFGCPKNQGYSIVGSTLGSPISGHVEVSISNAAALWPCQMKSLTLPGPEMIPSDGVVERNGAFKGDIGVI